MKKITEKELREKAKELEPYQNQWVALVDDHVVASGAIRPRKSKKKPSSKATEISSFTWSRRFLNSTFLRYEISIFNKQPGFSLAGAQSLIPTAIGHVLSHKRD